MSIPKQIAVAVASVTLVGVVCYLLFGDPRKPTKKKKTSQESTLAGSAAPPAPSPPEKRSAGPRLPPLPAGPKAAKPKPVPRADKRIAIFHSGNMEGELDPCG